MGKCSHILLRDKIQGSLNTEFVWDFDKYRAVFYASHKQFIIAENSKWTPH